MEEVEGRIATPRPRRSARAGAKKQTAEDPRSRMLEAMLACVGEQGYSPTVVADVITRAVASRKTFYEHFEDRQACFLALSDEIAGEWAQRVVQACTPQDGAGQANMCELLIEQLYALGCERPAALRMVTVELTAAGAAGMARRERLLEQLASPLLAGFGGEQPSTKLLARSIVGAILRMLFVRSRRGAGVRRPRRGQVQELARDVTAWARRYESRAELPPIGPPLEERGAGPPVGGRAPGTLSLSSGAIERRGLPRGEGNVSRSFVIHNQRERILDALANLAAAKGYGATTIPDIVREAAVSVQAFYEHFSGKDDAFLVAYEIGHRKGLAIVERAYETRDAWPEAVRTGIATLLEFLASEPSYAHLALIDALTASPKSATVAHEGMAAYAAMLKPGIDPDAEQETWTPLATEATASALSELCFVYIASEQTRELPRLEDLACEIALRPFASLSVR